MVRVCIICKYKYEKGSSRSFHKFPADIDEKIIWCKILKVDPGNISNKDNLCSDHFSEYMFFSTSKTGGRARLVPGALPSEFTSTSNPDEIESNSDDPNNPNHEAPVPETENVESEKIASPRPTKKCRMFDSPGSVLREEKIRKSFKKPTKRRFVKAKVRTKTGKYLEKKLNQLQRQVILQSSKIRKLNRIIYQLKNKLHSLSTTLNYLFER